jgi:hypothetical protein
MNPEPGRADPTDILAVCEIKSKVKCKRSKVKKKKQFGYFTMKWTVIADFDF